MSTATLEVPTQGHDATVTAQTGLAATADSMQLVSFNLGEETYGIEITKIREIILMGQITQIPETPHYIKGLINLRSTVIPVIDLRARFGLANGEQTDESRIMVLNVGKRTIGIVVDAVSEVLRIQQDQIAPPPPTVAGLGREYLTGLVKLENRLLILLDIDKILSEEDVAAVDAATAGL
ncbi:chemotaxis protein CheW [candidate division GN15 bacterium]|nr:chemotaxis protein CheW [candidate division GN15 bacterium]